LEVRSGYELDTVYMKVNCEVLMDSLLSLNNLPAELDLHSETHWKYWFIRGIVNPNEFIPETFRIAYVAKSSLTWLFQGELVYFISVPPDYMKIMSIRLTDSTIRSPSNYTFEMFSNNLI